MDLDWFSDTDFNVNKWINMQIKSEHEAGEVINVEKIISKLRMFYKQVDSDLNQTSLHVMSNLPRVLHDIDVIGKEASQLKLKMNSVKQEIANVEKNTGSSIAAIEKIDKLKAELVIAKQALYEADNWTVLSNDIEAVFETGDIEVIAAKLLSMNHSLNALSSASDYDSKKTQLEGLKNRLEALASPYVVEAIAKKFVEESKKFVRIFEDMDRFPLLIKYYTKCQKVNLMQQWQSTVDFDTDENVVDCFKSYFDFLTTNWHEQEKWCHEVMPNVSSENLLIELYCNLLASLSAEFSETIESHIKRVEESLLWLNQIKSCFKNFANTLISKSNSFSSEHKTSLLRAIYLPLAPYISKYGVYQKAEFSKQLTHLKKSDDVMEGVQSLSQMNSKIILVVEENLKICEQLTESCCMPSFVTAVEWFFKSYLSFYKSSLSDVKKSIGSNSESNVFQMCVTILQSLGELAAYVKQVDNGCVEILLATNSNSSKCITQEFSKLLLDQERQSELRALIQNLTEANEPCALKASHVMLESICRDAYQTCFSVIFTPVSVLLESVASMTAWKAKAISAELPDYSYAPQEYITQIGQYLMNLPQLLEPFLSLDNPSLTSALTLVGEYSSIFADESGFVELFLGRVTDATCRTYCEQILTISSLESTACKQMATDINYLGNVLEDLGFSLSEKLANILLLLKLTAAEYGVQSAGLPPQLVAAIRQMRNIISE